MIDVTAPPMRLLEIVKSLNSQKIDLLIQRERRWLPCWSTTGMVRGVGVKPGGNFLETRVVVLAVSYFINKMSSLSVR